MTRPRVLLADDRRIVAEGLRRLLEAEFDLVDLVEDGVALLEAGQRHRPDVIVADIGMPHLNGIDALTDLRKTQPDARVVFLTMHRDSAYLQRARAAGALGYVLKHSAADELVTAVNAALKGREFVTPSLVVPPASTSRQTATAATLTARRREILQLVVNGKLTKQIADELAISARTVEFHRFRMKELLGARNTAEMVRLALRHGLVDPPNEG